MIKENEQLLSVLSESARILKSLVDNELKHLWGMGLYCESKPMTEILDRVGSCCINIANGVAKTNELIGIIEVAVDHSNEKVCCLQQQLAISEENRITASDEVMELHQKLAETKNKLTIALNSVEELNQKLSFYSAASFSIAKARDTSPLENMNSKEEALAGSSDPALAAAWLAYSPDETFCKKAGHG